MGGSRWRGFERGRGPRPFAVSAEVDLPGANYVDHLKEMGITEIPDGMEPYFFLLPATTIVGPGEQVVIPDDPGYQVDWEA
jgi:2-keto-4-pentenoate hydratase/2-oxohepta-3-ene-1,7-dioic acid hydratase in catechol pathway